MFVVHIYAVVKIVCGTWHLEFARMCIGVYYLSIFLVLRRQVSLVEQELLTLSDHPSSPPAFRGVHVTRSLVLCVCFVDSCLSFCPLCCLSFELRGFITPLISSKSS